MIRKKIFLKEAAPMLSKKNISLALALLMSSAPLAASAQNHRDVGPSPVLKISEGDSASARRVILGVGKSLVIDLPRDAKEVFVSNPAVANAVVRSSRKAFVIGVAAGQTSIFFLDGEGRQIAALETDVSRDLQPIRAAIRSALPGSDIKIDNVNSGVVLTGSVASPVDSQKAVEIAARFVGSADQVVNSMTIRGRDQVMLKVTVAEVSRTALKQLGVNMGGSWQIANQAFGFETSNAVSQVANAIGYGFERPSANYGSALRALERNSLLRTLAEPNLTAVSGESATFLAGGEVPVPVGRTCSTNSLTGRNECTTQVEFKKFGVSLNFTPVVLAEGRISLKVATEVSELTLDSALSVGSGENAINIPALKVRKADTTVELPSGGALAIAGLIQDQTRQAVEGVPGMQNVPVLGTLFRSRDYQRAETELMIVVTPYIARPVARQELALPDDGFANPTDPSGIFLGRLNKIYGVAGGFDPKSPFHGRFGFITD